MSDDVWLMVYFILGPATIALVLLVALFAALWIYDSTDRHGPGA